MSESDDDMMHEWKKELKELEDKAKASLLDLSQPLVTHGVKVVVVEYDGCSGQGWFERIDFHSRSDEFGSRISVSDDLQEQIVNVAFDLLPGDWKINEGSFGELRFYPKSGRIVRKHNWRFIEVETEEAEL